MLTDRTLRAKFIPSLAVFSYLYTGKPSSAQSTLGALTARLVPVQRPHAHVSLDMRQGVAEEAPFVLNQYEHSEQHHTAAADPTVLGLLAACRQNTGRRRGHVNFKSCAGYFCQHSGLQHQTHSCTRIPGMMSRTVSSIHVWHYIQQLHVKQEPWQQGQHLINCAYVAFRDYRPPSANQVTM